MAEETNERFLVGFAQDNVSLTWLAQQVFALKAALEQYPNIDFIFTDAKGSSSKAVSDI